MPNILDFGTWSANYSEWVAGLATGNLTFELWLKEVGLALKLHAQSKFGHYQRAIGQFPAWPQLSLATIYSKGKDEPLIDTGTLMESVEYKVGPDSVQIGTNVPYALFSELGTVQEPPRPVFGPTLEEVVPQFIPLLAGEVITAFFVGRAVMGGAAGMFATEDLHERLMRANVTIGAYAPLIRAK